MVFIKDTARHINVIQTEFLNSKFNFYILQIVQNTETKIEIFGVKKLFTEAKVLAFLLWVIAFGIFTSFILYFLFLYVLI